MFFFTANGQDGRGFKIEKMNNFFSRYSPASRKKSRFNVIMACYLFEELQASDTVVVKEVVLSSPGENYDFPKHYCVGSLEAT